LARLERAVKGPPALAHSHFVTEGTRAVPLACLLK
jgi:hypothetical protein